MKTAISLIALSILTGVLTINHVNTVLDANAKVLRHNPALSGVMIGFDNTRDCASCMNVVTFDGMQPFGMSAEDGETASHIIQPVNYNNGQVTANAMFVQNATAHIQGSSNEQSN